MDAEQQHHRLAQHSPDYVAYPDECQPSEEERVPAGVRVLGSDARENQDDRQETAQGDDCCAQDVDHLDERRANERPEGKESSPLVRGFDHESFRPGWSVVLRQSAAATPAPLGPGGVLKEAFDASHTDSP